jgi:hypothetical protein
MNEEEFIFVCNFTDCLSIYLAPDPSLPRSLEQPSSQWLGLHFDATDKEALFFQALKVFNPAAAVGGRLSATDCEEGKWEELSHQFERSIEQSTIALPMLRRLKEEYEDASYSPEEVNRLRDECLTVRSGTDDVCALSSLDKLIRACDEALKERSGLYFASD